MKKNVSKIQLLNKRKFSLINKIIIAVMNSNLYAWAYKLLLEAFHYAFRILLHLDTA